MKPTIIIVICLLSTVAYAGEPGNSDAVTTDMIGIVEKIESLCQENIDDYSYRLQDFEDKNPDNKSRDMFYTAGEQQFVWGQYIICREIFGLMGKDLNNESLRGGRRKGSPASQK